MCVQHQVSELHQSIWSNLYSLARDMWQSKINVMTHSAFLELGDSGKFVWNNSVWIIISVNCFVIINIQIPAPVRRQPQDNKECHTRVHPTLTKYKTHCLPFNMANYLVTLFMLKSKMKSDWSSIHCSYYLIRYLLFIVKIVFGWFKWKLILLTLVIFWQWIS